MPGKDLDILASSIGAKLKVTIRLTKLDALVRNSGLRQYQIAGICGIHPTTLGQYINGKKGFMARDIVALAKFFEVEPEDVVGWMTMEKEIGNG